MDTNVLAECEDFLFPKLRLSVRQRALYYHLLRHTHLVGRNTHVFAIDPVAAAIGVSGTSVREDVRSLHDLGCLVIEERSRRGHTVRVLLPTELVGIIPGEPPQSIDIESLDFSDRRFVPALLRRERSRCFYCLREIGDASCELDHVVSQADRRDHSYRNIVCACHSCNTTKQAADARDFVRSLYRKGTLSQADLEDRLEELTRLQGGRLVPDV